MRDIGQRIARAVTAAAPKSDAASLRAMWNGELATVPAFAAALLQQRHFAPAVAALTLACEHAPREAGALAALAHAVAEARQAGCEEPWVLRGALLLARRRGDFATLLEAAQAWRRVAPARPDGVIAMMAALRGLARLDEAEAEAAVAVAAFPRDSQVWHEAALVAEARGETEAVLARWAGFREQAPKAVIGFLRPLTYLRHQNRFDLTEELLAASAQAFPRHPKLQESAARLSARAAQARHTQRKLPRSRPDSPQAVLREIKALIGKPAGRTERWPAVLRQVQAARARFPDFALFAALEVSALRNLGRGDEAVATGRALAADLPNDLELHLEVTRALEDLGLGAQALDWTEAARARFAQAPQMAAAHLRVLDSAGQTARAEQAAAAALADFPNDEHVLREYARLASRRGDLPEALARLEEAHRRRPDDARIRHQIQTLREQLAEAPPPATAEGEAALAAAFESLGGTPIGCEFGMVQRHLGSIQVGLLRWSTIRLAELRDGLTHDFAGLGEAESTVLNTRRRSVDDQVYFTSDRRYGMTSHTFVRVADMPPEKMLQQTCRRLRFLRDKLIEDLQSGEKIFVYKSLDALDDAALRALHAALRRHGDVNLLAVLPAGPGCPRGSVRTVEKGLFLGRIGKFLTDPEGGVNFVEVETWDTLMRRATALRGSEGFPPRLRQAA